MSAFDHYGSGRGAGMPVTSTQGCSILDSEVHLLFARYGVGLQEWTLVGIIGHHGISEHVDMNDADFIDDEQNVVKVGPLDMRSGVALWLNRFALVSAGAAMAFGGPP